MQGNSGKRPIIDLIYSFVAYSLPTCVLQFIVLPFIARQLSSEDNGLFLTLFNAIRLFVSLLIVPLSNIRLLKKKECVAEPQLEKEFNFLFLLGTSISGVCVLLLGMFYYEWTFSTFEMMRLLAVLLLLAAHDYFAIAFRINITYKSILIDNLMIVFGYLLGLLLMLKFGYWELVFISGYTCGLGYTLTRTTLWLKGIKLFAQKRVVSKYCQLSVSSGLNNATTYCDKMLIYPLIGGYSVSVYNAAAVVSKMMSLVSVPLCNVLLSYIVDTDTITISKKKRKMITLFAIGGSFVIYGMFYAVSVIFCRILYPQYFEVALQFIPIILLAILFETYAGLLKVYLLRFERTILQVITSSIKIVLYLVCVLILNVMFKFGLLGFCLSILIANSVHCFIVALLFLNNLKKQNGGRKHV